MASDLSANMRDTTEAFVMAFDGNWSEDATLAQRAPGCDHTMLPASLGVPKRSKQEWAAYFKSVAPLITEAKVPTASGYGVSVMALH